MRCSVIVPTYNRCALLGDCLDALLRQNYPDYEVIVADDGSVDGTRELVRQQFPSVAYIADSHNHGSTRARNVGAAAAKGGLLLFTDDDCRAPSDWLRRHVQQYSDEQTGAAGGPLLPPEPGFCDRFYAAHYHDELVQRRRLSIVQGWPRLVGGNMSVRREVFESIGGFDEDFPHQGFDADLARRILRAGHDVLWDPRLAVSHQKRHSLGSFLRERFQKAFGSVMTDAKEGAVPLRRFIPFPHPAGTWRDWRHFRAADRPSLLTGAEFWGLVLLTRWTEVAGRAYYLATIRSRRPARPPSARV